MTIKPLADKVVVKKLQAEETTKSGIILSSGAQQKPQIAEIIAVGPGGIVDGNEIKRLFVLPEYQHKGFGRELMDQAEIVIAQDYNEIVLDASFPAKNIYRKRGYVETDYCTIIAENGDYLCYDVMCKSI